MKWIYTAVIAALAFSVEAQQATIKAKHPKYVAYMDSLKQLDYDFVFPVLGQRVYEKGFDIPYPAGVMFNTFVAKQNMVIDEIGLGVNNGAMVDFSDFITFSDIQTTIRNINLRPDLFILPFWNVYGIFGYSWSETRVVLSSPVAFETTAELQGPNYGIGTNLSAGVGPVWISGDANVVWADLDKFEKPVMAVNTSFRIGHTFVDYDKPTRNVAIWAGAFGSFVDNRTVGAIDLREIIPPGAIGDELKNSDWYSGLGPARKAVVDQILDAGAESDLIVNYDLAKRPANPWNMVIGFQYQFNKNWQLRAESGCLANARSF
jgi:hypothetical protein